MTLDDLIAVLREEVSCLDQAERAIDHLIEAIRKREKATEAVEINVADEAQRFLALEAVARLRGTGGGFLM